jgi:hypothetical protein
MINDEYKILKPSLFVIALLVLLMQSSISFPQVQVSGIPCTRRVHVIGRTAIRAIACLSFVSSYHKNKQACKVFILSDDLFWEVEATVENELVQ